MTDLGRIFARWNAAVRQLNMLIDDMDYVGPAARLGYAEILAPLTYVYDCRADLPEVRRHAVMPATLPR